MALDAPPTSAPLVPTLDPSVNGVGINPFQPQLIAQPNPEAMAGLLIQDPNMAAMSGVPILDPADLIMQQQQQNVAHPKTVSAGELTSFHSSTSQPQLTPP